VAGVAKDIPLSKIFRGVLPYIPAILIVIILVIAFPPIATWLPTLIYG
jgi:TRAP-type C4-dicarboxylate transport system permease large subunit